MHRIDFSSVATLWSQRLCSVCVYAVVVAVQGVNVSLW